MNWLKEHSNTIKALIVISLLTVSAVLSCEQNHQSPDPGIFTAHPVDSDPVPQYTFEPEELIGYICSPDSPCASGYLILPQPHYLPPADTYEDFFNFRLKNFSPKTEPLIKERFGDRLGIKKDSLWEYNSYNSHAVGFAVSLPAISVIEYGETEAYGSHTQVSESFFFNHLHYLTNLKEGTTYHYRVIVKDEDINIVALPDRTFTTKTFSGDEIKLYQRDFTHTATLEDSEYTGAPGLWITEPGVYVFMEDITSDGLGINVKSNDVTIDLNGHTLIYDNGVNPYNADNNGYEESGSYGIRAGLWNFINTDIYNGTVKQGKTGSAVRGPVFMYHMGDASVNEIAGLTVDYYSDDTSGMRGRGYIHHNLLYDRGNVINDRHAAVRALLADGNSSEVAYNSFRRFRQRGIDGAVIVRDNELYLDSFATNSFALGAANNAVLKNNKIFGMGDSPIGIGWGNNLRVADNFIYMWGYSPTKRFDEYERKSSIAGMRVTNYDNNVFENMLFEGNFIVLKATDNCTMARGIWTTNGTQDRNIVYRHNTVKVEAMPDNYLNDYNDFYNGNVNAALTAITVQGGAWVSYEIPDALIFEDNRLITNVNHITIGEGYGISSGVRFYRTTFEKIDRDIIEKFYAPVRLGFWYWNTLQNRIIDSTFTGVTEEEMTPYFYGGTGKMEVFYGERQNFQFMDGDNPLAGKNITLVTEGVTQIEQTDAEGKAAFDILSVRHLKFGNSLEENGVTGVPERTDYQEHTLTFSADGYYSYTLSL
jgi:hypothetical protein